MKLVTTTWVLAPFAGVAGAALASFGVLVFERTARGENWTTEPSRCACGRRLRPWENVPVVGWLAVGGRARCCGAALPAAYLVAELGTGLAWAGAAAVAGLAGVAAALVLSALVIVAAGVAGGRRRPAPRP
jgi:leader peptidase (prepilin peptidase)/N-methyltransferase